jgi:ComF family protein
MTFPPPFAAARAAFLYRATVRELVHHFKYGGKVQLRRPLGLLTARELAPFASFFAPQLLLPVPLHVRRLRQRGFNQAVLLGEVLARQWGVPLDRYQLLRTRWTEPQVNLSAAERVANVRGAFAVAAKHGLAGKRVLLVDDVYTTGSTVRECARLLAQAGAAAVGVVTVARAEE